MTDTELLRPVTRTAALAEILRSRLPAEVYQQIVDALEPGDEEP